ncbi:General transcription factor IIH subunit 4 [Verticillium nonalfalfae]|uniref:RNA polymerase II transcription factor B subunit 2 n=2 Tax=Verticillium TaxID=1036719 RepID=C9SWE7_VERA1|nr:RNA polymerase II transcription factor B subunit 2 [Verticillium alfalfae VaMs.102]XP_028492638.1 General transcription factor IIH subunit 4 [Verticillium nonalfalfae]EEY23112.1 RNA polymerase II transcription factor B subunit 2 [Verticillium alfalfae VaMs.102]RNJ54480.1 General transcription factor IIH subunit 4 [Verticillium nonalfalfae]
MSAGLTKSLQLADYLEKLPGTTFRKLYLNPSTALCISRRMLSPLAKTFVTMLLYLPGPIPIADLEARVKPEYKRAKDHALAQLRSLHMLQMSVPTQGAPQMIQLTANFSKSYREALEGNGAPGSFGVISPHPRSPEITIESIEKHARQKWDAILHYIVNSVTPGFVDSGGPKNSVKELLLAGQLVKRQGGSTTITQAGFTFLLQEENAQVWTLLLLWLDATDQQTAKHTDMLSFLFQLSILELDEVYDTEALSKERQDMLPSLMDFGLVYIPSHKPFQYFVTPQARALTNVSTATRTLTDGMNALSQSQGGPGDQTNGIIVETNYRVYAYTTSQLQIAVLSLFCHLSVKFPGMVSGRLTRQSVRQAIDFGITADQIISYLAAHAHEQMHRQAAADGKPVLPPTVVDQIRLWQLENERMKTTSGFLFRDFDDDAEYRDIARFADEIGVLAWRNDRKRMFFASKHEQIRDYLKLRKKA